MEPVKGYNFDDLFFKIWRNNCLRAHIISFLRVYQFSNDFLTKKRSHDYSFRNSYKPKTNYNQPNIDYVIPAEKIIHKIRNPDKKNNYYSSNSNNNERESINKVRHYYDSRMNSEWISKNKYWNLFLDKINMDPHFKISYIDLYRFLMGNDDFSVFLRVYEKKSRLFETANYHLFEKDKKTILDLSCFSGNLEIIEFLANRRIYKFIFTNNAIDLAAEMGHYHVVKYLLDNYHEMKCKNALNLACATGNLDLVKLLHEKIRKIYCTVHAMNNAAKYGHFHIIKWLNENRNEGCSQQGLFYAIEYGNLAVIKFLYENYNTKLKISTKALDKAACSGNIEILDYLTKNTSSKLSPHSVSSACFNNDLNMFIYLVNVQFIIPNAFAFFGAAARGNLEIVKLLLSDPVIYSNERNVFKSSLPAISNNHIEVALYILRHISIRYIEEENCIPKILMGAAYNGNNKIIEHILTDKVLKMNSRETQIDKALEKSALRGHIEVMKTLIQLKNDLSFPSNLNIICMAGKENILPFLIEQALNLSIKPYKSYIVDISSPSLLKRVYELTKGYKIWLHGTYIKFNFIFPNDFYTNEDYLEYIKLCIDGCIEIEAKSLIYNLMSNSNIKELYKVVDLLDPTLHQKNRFLSQPTLSLIETIKQFRQRKENNMMTQIDAFSILTSKKPSLITLLIKVKLIDPLEISVYKIFGLKSIRLLKWWAKFFYTPYEDTMILDYYLRLEGYQLDSLVLKILKKLKDQIIPKDIENIKALWHNSFRSSTTLQIEMLSITGVNDDYMKYLLTGPNSVLRQEVLLHQKEYIGIDDEFLDRECFKNMLPLDQFCSSPLISWEVLSRFTKFDSEEIKSRIFQLFPLIKNNFKNRQFRTLESSFKSYLPSNNKLAIEILNAILRFYKKPIWSISYLVPNMTISILKENGLVITVNMFNESVQSIHIVNDITQDVLKIQFNILSFERDLQYQYYNTKTMLLLFYPFGKPNRNLFETLDLLPIIKSEIDVLVKKLIDISIEHSFSIIEKCFESIQQNTTSNELIYADFQYPTYYDPYAYYGVNFRN